MSRLNLLSHAIVGVIKKISLLHSHNILGFSRLKCIFALNKDNHGNRHKEMKVPDERFKSIFKMIIIWKTDKNLSTTGLDDE